MGSLAEDSAAAAAARSRHGLLAPWLGDRAVTMHGAALMSRCDTNLEKIMQIGLYEVTAILDGTFALDGGSMFGVVPKPLWERAQEPDERNRVRLASRLLYIQGAGRRILVDTGLGDKWDEKRREIFQVDRSAGGVLAALGERGIEPGAITDVILTHLHFDHAAGTTFREKETLQLTFPNAIHHVQRRHWDWAFNPTLKDAGSFRAEDFALLAGSDRLHLLEGEIELFEGIEIVVLDGHTPAMQVVKIRGPETTLLYLADLVPTTTHLRWPYIMSYDNEPLVTLAEKQRYLLRAAREGWLLVFEHDPQVTALRVSEDNGVLVPGPPRDL